MTDRALQTLKRRLETWELDHLRRHSAELDERLERAQDDASRAWESAEFWRENALQLQEDLVKLGATVGITRDGQMGAIKAAEPSDFLKEGERYIGVIGDASGNLNHVILLPGETKANWNDAMSWAESIGGELPTRVEQALLFATAKNGFKEDAYWSCEEHSSEPGWAWYQYFFSGGQYGHLKRIVLRARAVRRLTI